VRNVKVTNDVAERAVAMISQYAAILTKYEEMRDFLLQGVEDHRRKYPNVNKSTLNA
jgi:hypothetical protein